MKRVSGQFIRLIMPFAALVALQWVLAEVLSRYPLLEHLLSPGKDSMVALIVTALFLVLRMFLLLFGLGWLLARIWLWVSRPEKVGPN